MSVVRGMQYQLAPMLLDRDANRVKELWHLMYRVTRWYGRNGAALSALGALDTAFWDLRAQRGERRALATVPASETVHEIPQFLHAGGVAV